MNEWFLFAFIAAIFSACWSISIKMSNNYFTTKSITSIMGLVNFILNLIVFIYFGSEFSFNKYAVASGVFLMLVIHFFSQALIKVNNPGIPTALLRFQVVITFFMSLYFFNSKFEYLKLVFILLMIVGIFLLLGKKSTDDNKLEKKKDNTYLLYVLGSIISFSIYDIFIKKASAETGIINNVLITSGVATILFIIVQFAIDKNIGLIEILNQKDSHISFFNNNKYLLPLLSGLFLFCQQIFLIQSIKLSPNPAYSKAILASQILITTLVSQFLFKNAKIATTQIIGMLIVLGAVLGMTFE